MARLNLLVGTYFRANVRRMAESHKRIWGGSIEEARVCCEESWVAVDHPGREGSSWPLPWWKVADILRDRIGPRGIDGPCRKQPRLNLLAPRHALVRLGWKGWAPEGGTSKWCRRQEQERTLAARVAEAANLDAEIMCLPHYESKEHNDEG